MRYSESLRYGKLVDAQSFNSYSLYSEWNLVCPYCKEPVFFASGFERSPHSRTAPKSGYKFEVPASVVSASFRHFDGDKNICDSYSSSITKNDFVRVAAKHRQQRLEKWNSSFLSCLGYEKRMKGSFFNAVKASTNGSNKDVKEVVSLGAKSLLKFAFNSEDQIIERAEKDIALVLSAQIPSYLSSKAQPFVSFISSVSKDEHLKICREAIKFLGTRSAQKIAIEIQDLTFFLMSALGDYKLPKVRDKSDIATMVLCQIQELGRIICFNNWYD